MQKLGMRTWARNSLIVAVESLGFNFEVIVKLKDVEEEVVFKDEKKEKDKWTNKLLNKLGP
jgi:hypothetical protein